MAGSMPWQVAAAVLLVAVKSATSISKLPYIFASAAESLPAFAALIAALSIWGLLGSFIVSQIQGRLPAAGVIWFGQLCSISSHVVQFASPTNMLALVFGSLVAPAAIVGGLIKGIKEELGASDEESLMWGNAARACGALVSLVGPFIVTASVADIATANVFCLVADLAVTPIVFLLPKSKLAKPEPSWTWAQAFGLLSSWKGFLMMTWSYPQLLEHKFLEMLIWCKIAKTARLTPFHSCLVLIFLPISKGGIWPHARVQRAVAAAPRTLLAFMCCAGTACRWMGLRYLESRASVLTLCCVGNLTAAFMAQVRYVLWSDYIAGEGKEALALGYHGHQETTLSVVNPILVSIAAYYLDQEVVFSIWQVATVCVTLYGQLVLHFILQEKPKGE